MSAIPLENVEVNKVTPVEDYWSETTKELEVSPSKPDIIITQNEEDEVKKETEVIDEWPKELQKESKEDQPLVLVKPPIIPCIPIEFKKGLEVKERSQIFYTADTFVSGDRNAIESFVLKVPNELPNLKEGMPILLPKALDASFFLDISHGEGIT
ncbi:hypothetical protein Sjap_005142 [Stephania japonica]|uniref:Uncharacterized protein n=1 Tax=Stephania japonica TaxID=461633 RepID=A0AAP0PJS1_9MAGN